MSLALGVLATAFGSLVIIVNRLRNAPEAYEDEYGFHVVRKRAGSSGILRRGKYAEQPGSGSLRGARAHL